MTSITERLEALHNLQKKAQTLHKPFFYNLNNPTDLKKIEDLMELSGITVVDHILEQITEFVKLKSPSKKFSTEELKLETEKHIGKTELHKYGVWVYYPWSNRLVHILDKEEFIDVRTSRNQYKITKEERDELATKKIGIIGLSVGQSVSVTLAMERICGELRLADFDVLELTNLNRIRTGVHNLGLAKVYSVAREISEIDPYLNVVCFPEGLTENNMMEFFTKDGVIDLLVEESDGFDIKILSRYKARELGVPVIMEASDKCMVDVERFDLEPNRNILHGIVKQLDIATLKSLKTNEEKIPYMLDILGLNSTSPRLRASMLEMQQTISTWPQLGSAVTMGGGITADVSRRILLNQFTDSGRYYVDIDKLIGNKDKKQDDSDTEVEGNNGFEASDLKQMFEIASRAKDIEFSELNDSDAEKIVEAGVAAPSQANAQPWKWLLFQKKLFLFKHKNSSYKNLDEESIWISLGAAIENAVLMAEETGYEVTHRLLPLTKSTYLIAVLNFKKETLVKKQSGSLSPFIFKRVTNRKAGNFKQLKSSALNEISNEVNTVDGSLLTWQSDRDKIESIAKIAGKIERIRLLNPITHLDYFKNEIRWNYNEAIKEGIDIRTLELPSAVQTAFEMIADPKVAALLNKWDKGIAFEKFTQNIIASSSAIGLITMPGNTPSDYIKGGKLAQRAWLAATKNSLGFQPICVPLLFLRLLGNKDNSNILTDKNFSELKALKSQLSLIFGELDSREAVFLFRLFESAEPQGRSLRKSLNDVFFKS
ncbi:Rv1355c family protein [Aurantibacillus circumpalustris]|uniref:Rv1355c family protein n=1 Tax=Aurantibacillus circumpalustris TaxID=3036359 RepID=UPI00295BA76D|nr:Rv1355c family protein [Aurantibacillus circumpalustris]